MRCGRREMKSFHDFVRAWDGKPGSPATGLRRWEGKPGSPATGLRRWGAKPGFRPWRDLFIPVVLLAVCLGLGRTAHAQVMPAADAGGMRLSAGGTVSDYVLGYGKVKVLGASAFVDVDALRHFGFEGEARWLVFHLKADRNGPAADEHAATYMIGPRYSRYYGGFQPYAKALVGFGQFNYPYNLGTDK